MTLSYNSEDPSVLLEWEASPENDMWADSVVSVVLQIESSPASVQSKCVCVCV